MSRLKTRLPACAWLDDRITSAGATDEHDNAAIFSHHDGPDRWIASRLLYDTLKCYVAVLPRHVVMWPRIDILMFLWECKSAATLWPTSSATEGWAISMVFAD